MCLFISFPTNGCAWFYCTCIGLQSQALAATVAITTTGSIIPQVLDPVAHVFGSRISECMHILSNLRINIVGHIVGCDTLRTHGAHCSRCTSYRQIAQIVRDGLSL